MTRETRAEGQLRRPWRAVGIAAVVLGLIASTPAAQGDDETATVTGTVVGVDGSTDTHARVSVSPVGGGSVQSADVAADGTFQIDDIVPGDYYVTAGDTRAAVDAVYGSASWNGSNSEPGHGDGVELTAGATEVSFELPYVLGVVVSAVDVETDTPLPNVALWTQRYDAETDTWLPLGHDAPLTREDGRGFVGTSVERDTVRICLRDANYSRENRPVYRYGTACWENGDDIEEATPITVSEDDRKIEITVPMEAEGLAIWHEVPVVHGRAEVGETLTVEPLRWEPAEVELGYEWGTYEGAVFAPIAGATDRTFVPTPDLDGELLAVRITGEAEGHVTAVATASAGEIGALAPEVESFELSGAAIEGGTVTAEVGATTPEDDVNVEITWYSDGLQIEGARGESLEIADELAGTEIAARAYVHHFPGVGEETEYETSRTLFASLPAPQITAGAVSVDGPFLPQVKDALSARIDGWDEHATLTYQWYRGTTAISGATRPFYLIGSADWGHTLSVEVTATAAGLDPLSVRSEPTRSVGLGGVVGPGGGDRAT